MEPIFSTEYLAELLALPEVEAARANLSPENEKVQFTIPVTETIRSALLSLGLDIATWAIQEIPMRWIQGDTAPHVDSGPSAFENTYLIYLTDSPGEFVLGETVHPIAANTAFVFNEGVQHETRSTGTVPRLLLGPMNEFGHAVGGSPPVIVWYYSTYAGAFAGFSGFQDAYSVSYIIGDTTVGDIGTTTSWRIARMGDGSNSPPSTAYSNGTDITSSGLDFPLFVYPATTTPPNPCFMEGTTVLCYRDGVEAYVPIETLTRGTSVLTPEGYKKVELMGRGTINNRGDTERVQDRLYRCPVSNYPQLTDDLYITGCHSILVPNLSDKQRRKIEEAHNRVFITGNKYRLMAYVDERAEPWASAETYTIWHLALENKDVTENYGIYVNGGLLVETCCIQRMRGSKLTLC
jgi:hypothetical protein